MVHHLGDVRGDLPWLPYLSQPCHQGDTVRLRRGGGFGTESKLASAERSLTADAPRPRLCWYRRRWFALQMLQVANCLSPSAAKNDNESCLRHFEHLCRGEERLLLDPAGEGEDILNGE